MNSTYEHTSTGSPEQHAQHSIRNSNKEEEENHLENVSPANEL
jgi:hypothetical protein